MGLMEMGYDFLGVQSITSGHVMVVVMVSLYAPGSELRTHEVPFIGMSLTSHIHTPIAMVRGAVIVPLLSRKPR